MSKDIIHNTYIVDGNEVDIDGMAYALIEKKKQQFIEWLETSLQQLSKFKDNTCEDGYGNCDDVFKDGFNKGLYISYEQIHAKAKEML